MTAHGSDIAIAINGLSKAFGDVIALDGISLVIPAGKCYGLLGPNGAGKTTLMNIISTYLAADTGEVNVNGLDSRMQPLRIRGLLGVVPQEVSLYDEFTARENIAFFGGLYKNSPALLKKRTNELLKLLDLEQRSNEPVKRFSGGMKRRLNIACSLAHDPPIILMDEPTVGIDPQSRNFIYEFIENLTKAGRTIVYTSHYMEEVERLCGQTAIIDRGKIIAEGTKDELIELVKGEDVVIIELGDIPSDNLKAVINEYSGLSPIQVDGSLRLTGPGIHRDVPGIVKFLLDTGITPKSVQIHEPNLETVFLKLTGRELRD
jgi:ABC-2 type transport system ATP-binding protein